MNRFVLALTIACMSVMSGAGALPSGASAELRSAPITRNIDERRMGLFGMVRNISAAFREPISLEYSLVQEDRSPLELGEFPFMVKKGETLASVLDRFCAATGDRFQWGRIRGVLWVWPAEGEKSADPTLDVRVTLRISAASTWQALLDLSRAVNANTPHGRYLRPAPAGAGDNGNIPIESLRDRKTISLDLIDVTAREALCAILAASPLRLRLTYGTFYSPRSPSSRPLALADIWVYDENYELVFSSDIASPENRDERLQWMYEMDSVIPPRPETPAAAPEPGENPE